MVALNHIDKKIIYQLSKNARLSYKQIARNINSKKQVISYHIKKLEEKGVISKYVPVFSLSRLGIFADKLYIKLHGLSEETEEEMYESLINNDKVAWVAESVGKWDLFLGFYSRNVGEFSKIKEDILSEFSQYIQEYDVTHIAEGLVFNRDYLIDKPTNYRNEFVFGGNVENQELNEKKLEIANLIKDNGRYRIVDLAGKLDIDARTVKDKIKSMEDKGILQGFTTFINLRKIGLQLHKLCIYLQNYDKDDINELVSYLKKNPHTVHLIKALGSWEYEVEMEYSSMEKVHEYIKQLKNKFPKLIKQIDLATITEEPKLEFFPEDMYNF